MNPNMPMPPASFDQPPVIARASRLGKVGLGLSLVAPAVIVLMVVLQPG